MITSPNSKNLHEEMQQLFIRTLTELSKLSVDKQRYELGQDSHISPSLYFSICKQMKFVHRKLKRISHFHFRSLKTWSHFQNDSAVEKKLTQDQYFMPEKPI